MILYYDKFLEGYIASLEDDQSIYRTFVFLCSKINLDYIKKYVKFLATEDKNLKFSKIIKKDLSYIINKEKMPKKIIFKSQFYKKLYLSLNKIQKRESLCYSEVFGVKYARAVGTAMKNNYLPILIPCHKIVGKNNKDLFTTSCFDLKPKCCKNIDVKNCAKNIKERLRKIT